MNEAPAAFPLDHGGPVDLAFPGFSADWLDRPVFARFAWQARRDPGHVAIRDRVGQVSYGELAAACLSLASWIDREVPAGAPIALALPVDRNYPAAMLAALAAGRPYVPLNPAYPPESLRHVLAHCGASHVLTTEAVLGSMRGVMPEGMTALIVDARPEDPTRRDWQPAATPEDNAYILYTSGSSGAPKGVYQDQRGLMHDVMQYTCSAHLGPGDVLTCLYSPSVNGALRDIFGALLNGATLLLFDLKTEGLGHLAQEIQRCGATILHAMPPVLRAFLRTLPAGLRLDRVRLVYLAGDRLVDDDLARLRERLGPGATIYFGIGSTECATLYRQWFIPPSYRGGHGIVPAGRAVPDRQVEILGPTGEPLPIGEIGEIAVTSRYLARGYWHDAAQTRARFTPVQGAPGAMRFLTGDLGSIDAEGLLTFHGRNDQQVKIRGYRVEPGGIEAALRALPGVEEAAVVVLRRETPQLIAFLVHAAGTNPKRIARNLRERLPLHSCPAAIHALPRLPLLDNFKVDMAALTALANERARAGGNAVRADAGDDSLTATAERCWREVLSPVGFDPALTFLESGGDSLKALELHVALEEALGRPLPAEGIGLDMTVQGLAEWLRRLPPTAERPAAAWRVQLFVCPPAEGIQPIALALRDQLADAMTVCLLDYPDEAKRRLYSVPVAQLAEHCAAEIRRRREADCKLVILGQSFGSRVAHAAATRLAADGITADLLVMTDIAPHRILTPPPRTAPQWARRALRWLLGPVADQMFESASGGMLARLAQTRRMERQVRGWQAEPFAGKALLVVSAETLQRFPRMPVDLGWARLCPDLVVQPLGLTHHAYAAAPASRALAALIRNLSGGQA